ncbi:MAG: hypothetical protein JNK77_01425 [Saprospiraceae bacterium]|nr:hypothetical protein [Saprospiraceae bacterium]
MWYGTIGPKNQYQYNGKELNEDFGLHWYDFGARWQDPAAGRWWVVDALAEDAPAWTPFRYGFNNPVLYTDPLGLFETRDEAKEHRKKENIEGRIRKQDDGSYAIVHRGSGGKIKTYDDAEFGVMTEFAYVERGVHLRDIGLDGFNDLNNPYSEAYNPDAVVYTDGADIAYALGSLLGFAMPSARVVTAGKTASTVATQAVKTGTRSLDDLSSLRGASWKEAENLIPKDWVRGPLKKGEGIKFVNPHKKGEQILLEKGWPGAKDPLHAGPYMKISRDGQVMRIPLVGNPTLK